MRVFGKLLRSLSVRPFIAIVRQFHEGMLARVQKDGEFSNPFPVTNGVKQGCVLAPTLISMRFSAMLTAAFQEWYTY